MKNYSYEEVLTIKDRCYQIIKKYLGNEYLQVFKYYKGDLLPLINTKCRKDMTAGDKDGVQWDFNKKIYRIIESKRTNEIQKSSQDRLLKFETSIQISNYQVEVYKIIGDPPFETSTIINMANDKIQTVNHNQLIDFLNI